MREASMKGASMADSKRDQSGERSSSGSGGADLNVEEAYWREQHAKQPYADKSRSYDDYAPAYRTGYEGASKYTGRSYDEIEDDLALDYEKARAGAGVPWDTARPAVKAAWDKVSGVIAPRQPDRGARTFI